MKHARYNACIAMGSEVSEMLSLSHQPRSAKDMYISDKIAIFDVKLSQFRSFKTEVTTTMTAFGHH